MLIDIVCPGHAVYLSYLRQKAVCPAEADKCSSLHFTSVCCYKSNVTDNQQQHFNKIAVWKSTVNVRLIVISSSINKIVLNNKKKQNVSQTEINEYCL